MEDLALGVAQKLLEKILSRAYDEVILAWYVKDDLEKLKDTISVLKTVLEDAEKKQKQKQNEGVRIWLAKLKGLSNDAVNVFDEFDCELLRRRAVKEHGTVGRKVRRFCSLSNPIVYRFRLAQWVKEIKERFDGIANEMTQFELIRTAVNAHEQQSHLRDQERIDRMTHSFVQELKIIGRDDDKERIIDMLMLQDGCDGINNLSLVPIIGIGGLGKTTLAKSVFNDVSVLGTFDLKLWVCVSLDFDVTHLLREILKCATGQDSSSPSLELLQTSVRTALKGKRFLLVLDDVWNEDNLKWCKLREFITEGAKGSKVIVTTRSETVSSIMTRAPPYILQGLSEKDSMSLFFRCSLGDANLAGQDKELNGIGGEIVKKCRGVPLALESLGSLLYSKPRDIWIKVRESEIWEQEDDHILPALRLSYNALSSCTKQCFASCSTFCEDTQMVGFKLMRIWMALGILQSPNDNDLEDCGNFQLRELCARSLFQRDDACSDNEMTNYGLSYQCNMHDLIHDLARSVTKSECSIIKSGREGISDNLQCVRLFINENSSTVVKRLNKLWTIHIDHTTEERNLSESFLSKCISELEYLRVLDFSGSSFEVLPRSIGNLKHLRYLDLSANRRIKRLPNSICKLQSLQTLLLGGCEELEELPKDMRSLFSLRTLVVTTKQTSFPENGVGVLKSLRTLVISGCTNLRSLPNDIGSCKTLRTLVILECQELDFATTPNEHETKLSLERFVIDKLPQAKTLPQWLKGASCSLRLLVIRECDNLVSLPEWLPDLASLQKLVIKECNSLVALPVGMQRLTSLTDIDIQRCAQLELGSETNEAVPLSLQSFSVFELPKTTSLPQWLRGASDTLQHLSIYRCPQLAALPEWLPYLTSLKKLAIMFCPELSTLPEGMSRLTSLTVLQIGGCSSAFHERYARGGEDWKNIEHVLHVYCACPPVCPPSYSPYSDVDILEDDLQDV